VILSFREGPHSACWKRKGASASGEGASGERLAGTSQQGLSLDISMETSSDTYIGSKGERNEGFVCVSRAGNMRRRCGLDVEVADWNWADWFLGSMYAKRAACLVDKRRSR